MNGFILDLSTLPSGMSHRAVEAEARDLDLSDLWVGPVHGRLDVERSGDRLTVRGVLEARARLECVSCLTEFERPVRAPIEAFAERSGTGSRGEQDELERDSYMLFHDGRRLDLREQAREALLLEIPIAPRCREDCAGLCPVCGADRNLGPHVCGAA